MKNLLSRILPFIGLVAIISSCGKPMASFTYEKTGEQAPVEVEFNNQSKRAESYSWDFGDGNTSDEASPLHQYTTSGQYTIVLTAKKGKKSTISQKEITIDAPEKCLVEIETSFGKMTVLLYDSTPQHRDNFIKLAEDKFFDDLLFHRVIQGFMVQGGDPDSRNARKGARLGMGGPGYTLPAEFVDSLVHVKGVLSAARMGDQVNPEKKSSGSQFYIVQGGPVTEETLSIIEARKGFRYTKAQREAYAKLGGTPHLDRDYTIFGKVIEGMDVIDKIAAVKKDRSDRPLEDVKMKIRVIK